MGWMVLYEHVWYALYCCRYRGRKNKTKQNKTSSLHPRAHVASGLRNCFHGRSMGAVRGHSAVDARIFFFLLFFRRVFYLLLDRFYFKFLIILNLIIVTAITIFEGILNFFFLSFELINRSLRQSFKVSKKISQALHLSSSDIPPFQF